MNDDMFYSGKVGDIEWKVTLMINEVGEYLIGGARGPDGKMDLILDLLSKGEDESIADFVNGVLPAMYAIRTGKV